MLLFIIVMSISSLILSLIAVGTIWLRAKKTGRLESSSKNDENKQPLVLNKEHLTAMLFLQSNYEDILKDVRSGKFKNCEEAIESQLKTINKELEAIKKYYSTN